jgi:hypothetical protein
MKDFVKLKIFSIRFRETVSLAEDGERRPCISVEVLVPPMHENTSEMCVKSCANICIKLRNFGAPVSFCCHTVPWAQLKDIKETVQTELKVLHCVPLDSPRSEHKQFYKNIAWNFNVPHR